MRIAIGKDKNDNFIIKRTGSKRLNPFRVAAGKVNNWVELGICFGNYKRLKSISDHWYNKVNRFIYTDHKLNGTRRYYFVSRIITLEYSHEVR